MNHSVTMLQSLPICLFPLKPNAAAQPRLEAGAQRTL